MLQSLRRASQHSAGLALGGACVFASAAAAVASEKTAQKANSAPQGLSPSAWEELTVVKKDKVNHDTIAIRLGFKDSNAVSGLTIASCLLLKAPIGATKEDRTKKDVIRPYTPISDPDAKGYFDLMVKVYDEGMMSKHLGEVAKGDTILCKGPIQKLPYEANMKKRIGMIAGGTGITPMLQVLDAIKRDETDSTEVFLIYANKTPDDILLKDTLDELVKSHTNIHVHYVVQHKGFFNFFAPYSRGYITSEILEKHCPPASGGKENLVLVCGPPPMMKAISGDKAEDKSQGELTGLLASLGYTAEQVYKF